MAHREVVKRIIQNHKCTLKKNSPLCFPCVVLLWYAVPQLENFGAGPGGKGSWHERKPWFPRLRTTSTLTIEAGSTKKQCWNKETQGKAPKNRTTCIYTPTASPERPWGEKHPFLFTQHRQYHVTLDGRHRGELCCPNTMTRQSVTPLRHQDLSTGSDCGTAFAACCTIASPSYIVLSGTSFHTEACKFLQGFLKRWGMVFVQHPLLERWKKGALQEQKNLHVAYPTESLSTPHRDSLRTAQKKKNSPQRNDKDPTPAPLPPPRPSLDRLPGLETFPQSFQLLPTQILLPAYCSTDLYKVGRTRGGICHPPSSKSPEVAVNEDRPRTAAVSSH